MGLLNKLNDATSSIANKAADVALDVSHAATNAKDSIKEKISKDSSTQKEEVNPLEKMDTAIKVSYLKIVINLAYSDDDNVDEREYAEIRSLMTRAQLTKEERFDLNEYTTNSEKLEDSIELIAQIDDIVEENDKQSLFLSLVKDLLYLVKVTQDGSNELDSPFIRKILIHLDIPEEQVNLLQDSIDNDLKIFEADTDDKGLIDGAQKVLSTAGAVGVPIAAIYMSGSVAGLGAAGITSGLATLGFGGVLGLSSMVTGIGVVVVLGLGAHQGLKVLTGSKEIERKRNKEFMLQGVVKFTQRTINELMEDIKYFTGLLSEECQKGTQKGLKINKLVRALIVLGAGGKSLAAKSKKTEALALMTRLPSKLDISRLESLTKDATKEKFYTEVLSAYEQNDLGEETPQFEYRLRQNLQPETLKNVIDILEAINYFKISGVAKDLATRAGARIKGREHE